MKQFARIFGKQPHFTNTTHTTTDLLQLFAEAFGPAEILYWRPRRVLFWNFCDQDGGKNYTLFAQVPRTRLPQTVKVCLSARKNKSVFREWTAKRLAQIGSGDGAPLALNAHRYVVSALRPSAQ